MDIVLPIYVFGCIGAFIWAFGNYLNIEDKLGESNTIKVLKYITWGRLIYSVIFLPGLVTFHLLAILFWLLYKILEFFIDKNPLSFLGDKVFKNK